MNINPSDMDVRQGYAPADNPISTAQVSTTPQTNQDRRSAQPAEVDPKSQSAIAAADKKVALETAEKISKQLEENHTTIKIKLLDNTQDGVQVVILDKVSEKVLRKIPQDELLKLSASIKKMTGVFLNQST